VEEKIVDRSNTFNKGGGIFFLLPLLLYSYNYKGFSLSYTSTDNLYLLNIKDRGSVMSMSPFLRYENFLDLQYYGNFSVINFEASNLYLENYFELQKEFYLPGVGNKNLLYSSIYSFFPTSYEIYRFNDLMVGDSLNIYLGDRYLFSLGIKLKYKIFHSDSINNYLEPGINSSISIPLPYFFFTPNVSAGVKIYENEGLPFYKTSSHFYFPMTLDFSFTLSLSYYYLTPPKGEHPISIIYIDDPFFEGETLREQSELNIFLTKLFLNHYFQINGNLNLFEKRFFEAENMTRKDRGIRANMELSKMVNENISVALKLESIVNSSTLQDFEYTRNSIDLNLRLIFQ